MSSDNAVLDLQQNLNNRVRSHTLDIYTSNKPGVLARVSQIFARRGFNIQSLFVCPSVNEDFARMTISIKGDAKLLNQIIKQIEKLIDVISCTDITSTEVVVQELMLIKVKCNLDNRIDILQLANTLGGEVAHISDAELTLSVKAETLKVDLFISAMSCYGIVEIVRTGKVIMSK